MAHKRCDLQFAVLGLGRFGMSIVKTLSEFDVNILACDKDAGRVHEATEYATHAVQADLTDEEAVSALGLGNFDVVVVAAGEDFEAIVLATMIAKEQGAGRVVARAIGLRQQKILESVGADRVVRPETEMGAKLARSLVYPNVLDTLISDEKLIITEMHPLPEWVGKTIGGADIRRRWGYTILALIRGGKTIIPVTVDLTIQGADLLITLSKQR